MRNRKSRNNKLGWFLTLLFSLTVTAFSGLFPGSSSLANTLAKDEVAVIQKRTGKVTDSSLLSKRPPSGVVTDSTNWKSLWSAWQTGQQIPAVDFENQIVLVATTDGPNVVLTSSLNLTPSGDLRFETAASTKMTGPGFGYALLVVSKTGVLSVNGKKLTAVAPPMSASAGVNSTESKAPTSSMTSEIDELIRVEIQGRVRTGIMSRGKSTGTMVVANGIVWELDLGNDAKLKAAVRELGTDIGSIKGTLSKLNNPDRSVRWIVDVESIAAALPGSKIPSVVGELTQSQPRQPQVVAKTDPNSDPNLKMAPKIPVSRQVGFESIVISATGGGSNLERKQIVAADGSATLEIPKTDYSESFMLDPESLQNLHRFVASTDWRSVPRSAGTVAKDVTNFSITVVTKNGTKRFFIDEASLNSQPVISKLFSLMQRPKTDK